MRQRIVGLFALAAIFTASASTEGISVEHTGPQNTFVRVDAEKGSYLMIPVEENQADAQVRIIADGKQEGEFYVKLARHNVDYEAPFDLRPYRGKKLILDFEKPEGVRLETGEEPAGFEQMAIVDSFSTANIEKHRPLFHHTPVYGWMNDPNGMVYKDGEWHLFYQWNPYGSKWQNMTWGHSVSRDLIHWIPLEPALEPDALGSIFSGSAAIDHANTAGFGRDAIVAMYTSAGHSQMQSIAHSTDGGRTFRTYEGNPVIIMETEARDPKIFWNDKTWEWNMALAHALEHEVLLFHSPDLKHWRPMSAVGNVGATGGVWECPDLFELEDSATGEKKWVLLVNINPGGPFGGSATQYFVGDFNGKTFIPDTDADGNTPTRWMDYGKDFYATVTWNGAPSNRRVALGWMSNWEYADQVPTRQFRSANSLPRDLSLFTAPDGLTYLSSAPSPELLGLRGKAVSNASRFRTSKQGKTFALPRKNEGICEITLDIDGSEGSITTLTLANGMGEKVDITYNATDHTLAFDRTHAQFAGFSNQFPTVTEAPTFETDGHLSLRIYVDKSSIEVFANDGRATMTNLVFPETPYTSLSVSGSGKAFVENLNVYELNI